MCRRTTLTVASNYRTSRLFHTAVTKRKQTVSHPEAADTMNRFHELRSRRQADEFTSNLARLGKNSRRDTRAEVALVDENMTRRYGEVVTKHSHLQEISLELVNVTDPSKETATFIEYVRRHRSLTTLSLATAYLWAQDGTSPLEQRERIVDAFLHAATDNPSVTRVSLSCCRFTYGRLTELLRKPGLKHIILANCRTLGDLSQPDNEEEFLRALEGCVGLETLHMRRSLEAPSLQVRILLRLANLPLGLREIGLSLRDVATAAIFRQLIETESYQRQMKFALLGCELQVESATLLIEGFESRQVSFLVDMQGCKWESDTLRDWFFGRLILCPKLMKLSIDEDCGLSVERARFLEESVALRLRETLVRAGYGVGW